MSENAYSLRISRENFSKLLNLLKIFENSCTDCDVHKGMFRCRTNDRQAIVQMDLSSILQSNGLTFTLIKNKIALLKAFELDDNIKVDDKNILLESNDSNYEICDPFSRMCFRKPVQRFIDNTFISDDDFAGMIRISEDNLVFRHTINNYIKKRIANIALGHQTDVIFCQMAELTAELKIITSNFEDSTVVVQGIPLNRNIGSKQFKMISLPFIADVASDLTISCYTVSSDVYLVKFEQTFCETNKITIFTQVKVTNM
jgi:hypothetical protein